MKLGGASINTVFMRIKGRTQLKKHADNQRNNSWYILIYQ